MLKGKNTLSYSKVSCSAFWQHLSQLYFHYQKTPVTVHVYAGNDKWLNIHLDKTGIMCTWVSIWGEFLIVYLIGILVPINCQWLNNIKEEYIALSLGILLVTLCAFYMCFSNSVISDLYWLSLQCQSHRICHDVTFRDQPKNLTFTSQWNLSVCSSCFLQR